MQFTRIPNSYAPLGGPLTYAVQASSIADIEIRITDASRTRLYGAKRFAATRSAEFDIAPYLRRALRFTPTTGSTGVYDGDSRTLTAIVEASSSANSPTPATPSRTFLPSADEVSAPCLFTSMPLVRLIPDGAADELTLMTRAQQPITLTIAYGPHAATENHVIPSGGLHLFRLDTADFPNADQITVDAGPCGKVVYTVVKPVQEAVRLAWRSRSGSIEHYSFPIETTATVEATKRSAYGSDGYVSSATFECRRTLRSALETREVLEALAELLYTPEVWMVEGAGYTPVDVISDRAAVHNYGTMSTLEITFRPKNRPRQSWN